MAKRITLMEGRSHTVVMGGAEIKFVHGRPMTGVTDEALISYCENQPKGRFTVKEETPPKKAASKDEAPADTEGTSNDKSPEKGRGGKKAGKKGGRKKVKVGE